MSVVNGEKITAFNLSKKLPDQPMKVTHIFQYDPAKQGGKPKYRLAGNDVEHGDGMSRFCNETFAKEASKTLNIEIVKAEPKVRP